MADSGGIISIGLKYHLVDYDISGISLLFLKAEEDALLGAFSINVQGSALYGAEVTGSPAEIRAVMDKARREFETVPMNEKKLHDAFFAGLGKDELGTIRRSVTSGDTGSVAYLLRKIIGAALASEDMKAQAALGSCPYSVFMLMDARERAESIPLSKRTAMAAAFGNTPQTAEDVARNFTEDVTILTYASQSMSGFAAVNNLERTGQLHIGAPASVAVPVTNPIDFYLALQKTEGVVKRSLPGELVGSIVRESRDECLRVLTAAGFPGGEIALAKMNSVLLEAAVAIPEKQKPATAGDDHDKHIRKTIDVALILSPSKGMRLSELLPGNVVSVALNKDSPIGMKFIKNLNLLDENGAVKPLGAEIHGVKRDAKGGFTVYVKLTHDLYGKAYEEEDIRVKAGDPEAEAAAAAAGRSLAIGIVVSVIVLVIIAVLLAVFVL